MSPSNPLFLNRLIGKAIDLLIMLALVSVPLYPASALAAFLYILICDGLKDGRSLGKRVVGLRVINTTTGKPADFKDSVIRNSPIAVAALFFLIPLWGWLLYFIIGIPVLAMEVYLMRSLSHQARLGDTMADTKVLGWMET
jgi:uncharacterized RDD family membrane protein YckC